MLKKKHPSCFRWYEVVGASLGQKYRAKRKLCREIGLIFDSKVKDLSEHLRKCVFTMTLRKQKIRRFLQKLATKLKQTIFSFSSI